MQNQAFVSKSKTFEKFSSRLQFAIQLMRTYFVVLPGKDDSCGDGHAGNAEATAKVEYFITENIDIILHCKSLW